MKNINTILRLVAVIAIFACANEGCAPKGRGARHGTSAAGKESRGKTIAPAASASHTLTLLGVKTLCGHDKIKTMLAYRAVGSGDLTGAMGMESRGDVNWLASGTVVDVILTDGAWSVVSVVSGDRLGTEDCWMPTKMFTAAQ